ncbi:nose resistant to fluoxetine protein 6-like [Ptychodera flava]|uniref:nose resistant to fluoxetine protein 6-like n=1 Tax=Ptychodera flava TaxID=63121 RepID=UPI00396A641F
MFALRKNMAVQLWRLSSAFVMVLAGLHYSCSMQPGEVVRKFKEDIEHRKSLMTKLDEAPSNEEIMKRLKNFMTELSPPIAASEHNVSTPCADDMTVLVNDWPDMNYARQMAVSFGNRRQLSKQWEVTYVFKTWGLFDTCRDVKPYGNRTFGGKYCMAYMDVGLQWAVCFPDSCSNEDVALLITASRLGSTGNVDCAEDLAFRAGDYIAIVICSIIAGLMVLGTAYDVIWHWNLKRKIKRSEEIANMDTIKQELIKNKSAIDELKKKRPGVLGRILISFSVVANGRKILSTSSGGSGTISSINGIRVISMMWIVLGHTIIFSSGVWDNNRYVLEIVYKRFSALTVFAAYFGVDTFFLLSGCLVAYLTLGHMRKTKGKMNWLLFYFHRWWRLTPALGLMILIWSTVALYLGDGPIHDSSVLTAQKRCQDYWWAAIFYFNNLYPWPGTNDMCMGWIWYLFVDMQLHIISPCFIILLHKSRKAGTFAVASFAVASMATVAGLATYFGVPMDNDPVYYNDNLEPGDDFLYAKPWTRLQSYMVGVYLGYVLCRLNGKKVKINKLLNICIWCVAAGSALAVVYGPYPILKGNHPDQWVAVLYQSVSRFVFTSAVAWVIFACSTGNGGPVDTFLSWSAWSPLSRLTYCTYLVHPGIMYIYYWTRKTLIHFTDMNMTYYFVAQLVLSYAAAFIMSLAIESPMIGLEKIIFRR